MKRDRLSHFEKINEAACFFVGLFAALLTNTAVRYKVSGMQSLGDAKIRECEDSGMRRLGNAKIRWVSESTRKCGCSSAVRPQIYEIVPFIVGCIFGSTKNTDMHRFGGTKSEGSSWEKEHESAIWYINRISQIFISIECCVIL